MICILALLECRAEGGVDLGEMPKYTKYCTYIVYILWYGYGVTNLIIFSKSNLPFYLMKQILAGLSNSKVSNLELNLKCLES